MLLEQDCRRPDLAVYGGEGAVCDTVIEKTRKQLERVGAGTRMRRNGQSELASSSSSEHLRVRVDVESVGLRRSKRGIVQKVKRDSPGKEVVAVP